MQVITEIKDLISDAFDDMDILECDITGLFHYLKDCNEHFMRKECEAERLCYAVLFSEEAKKRQVCLTEEQIQKSKESLKKLENDYPSYYKEIGIKQ